MIRAVTFDITHTLIHVPRLGEIYAGVLGRHGIAIDPERARSLVVQVWQELACSADPARDRFTSHPEGARGWWKRLLERMCEHLGVPPPTPFAAAELFHRFASGEAYEVYPEVPGVLAALREQGVRLGVVSNWDDRLPKVLEELGLARFLDAMSWSAKVGAEKPDRRIFLHALEDLGAKPGEALHVGDGRLEDVEGAVAVGMRALHLTRNTGGGDLRDLSSLPGLIEAERAGRAGRQWAGRVLDS